MAFLSCVNVEKFQNYADHLCTHTRNSQFRIGSDSLTSTVFSRSIVWPFGIQNKALDPIETLTCKTVDVMDAAGSNHGNNWANLVELSKSKCGSEFRATLQSDGTLYQLHHVLIRAQFRMLMAMNLVELCSKSRRKCLNRFASLRSIENCIHQPIWKQLISSILTRQPINVWRLLAPHFIPSASSGKHRPSVINYPKVQHVSSIDVINYLVVKCDDELGEISLQQQVKSISLLVPSTSSGVCRCRFSREYVFIIFSLTCVCGPFRIIQNSELHNGATS